MNLEEQSVRAEAGRTVEIYKTYAACDATLVSAMPSTSRNYSLMGDPQCSSDVVEYIRIAAELLRELFCELQCLAIGNAALASAMLARDEPVRHRFEMLQRSVALLLSVEDEWIDVTLVRRSTSLISLLSAEIDDLALYATGGGGSAATLGAMVH